MKRRVRQPVNIESVIKARLEFQTTKNRLHQDFQLTNPSISTLTSKKMLSLIDSWDLVKQKKFFSLLGGEMFIALTERYFKGLRKHEQPETIFIHGK